MKKTKEISNNQKAQFKTEKKETEFNESKTDKFQKKNEEKKQIRDENDDSDDENLDINFFKKNSIPNPDFNKTITKMNIEQSNNYSLNLMKERGCKNYFKYKKRKKKFES